MYFFINISFPKDKIKELTIYKTNVLFKQHIMKDTSISYDR